MEGSCLSCEAISGCPFLADSGNELVMERLIMPEEVTRECEGWAPVGPRELNGRIRQYEVSGIGCLRALFILPPRHPDTLRLRQREEEEEQMREDTPDFTGMLREGMTVSEREEQLTYETDEAGNILFEETPRGPRKRPRASYEVRNFAYDPEKHIGMSAAMVFDQPDKIIKYILKEELKQGLIVKDDGAAPKKTKPPTSNTTTPKETNDMGNKVMISRGGKQKTAVNTKGKPIAKGGGVPAKAGGGEGRTAGPPKKTPVGGGKKAVAKPKGPGPGKGPAKAPTQAPAQAEEAQATAPFDVNAFAQNLLEEVHKIVVTEVTEAKNEILSSMVGQFHTNLKAMTALHDMIVESALIEELGKWWPHKQTNAEGEEEVVYNDDGSISADQIVSLSDHPSLLLAYCPEGQDGEEEEEGEGEEYEEGNE